MGVTGQYYDSRIVEGPEAHEAVRDFVSLAAAQVGLDASDFPFHEDEGSVTISMVKWPEDEGFGPWFKEWAARWGLTVGD